MRFSIDQKLLEALLNCIVTSIPTKPFNEVNQLLQKVQQEAKPIPETETEEKNPKIL